MMICSVDTDFVSVSRYYVPKHILLKIEFVSISFTKPTQFYIFSIEILERLISVNISTAVSVANIERYTDAYVDFLPTLFPCSHEYETLN